MSRENRQKESLILRFFDGLNQFQGVADIVLWALGCPISEYRIVVRVFLELLYYITLAV